MLTLYSQDKKQSIFIKIFKISVNVKGLKKKKAFDLKN